MQQKRDVKAILHKCKHVVVPGKSKALLHDCKLLIIHQLTYYDPFYSRGSVGSITTLYHIRNVRDDIVVMYNSNNDDDRLLPGGSSDDHNNTSGVHFIQVFVIVWGGSCLVTINAQLLRAKLYAPYIYYTVVNILLSAGHSFSQYVR